MAKVRKVRKVTTFQVELSLREAILLAGLAGQSFSGLMDFYNEMIDHLPDYEDDIDSLSHSPQGPKDLFERDQWAMFHERVEKAIADA